MFFIIIIIIIIIIIAFSCCQILVDVERTEEEIPVIYLHQTETMKCV